MKYRQGFVSNSSSASFVVGIPSNDRDGVIHTLFNLFQYDYFGKYYLREEIKKSLSYAEKRLEDYTKEYDILAEIPKEERLEGKADKKYDPLDWKKSSVEQWTNSSKRERDLLETLEEIAENSEKELVEFGLSYYGVGFSPTYRDKIKVNSDEENDLADSKSIDMSQWDPDATDDRDLEIGEVVEGLDTIVGYQLNDWVTMFNDYGDIPRILRNMTGVLAFVYDDLKCWVEEDD